MTFRTSRRQILAGALSIPALNLLGGAFGIRDLAAAEAVRFGPPEPFDFEHLREQAKGLAARPYEPTTIRFPDILERIDYDAYQQIQFRPDRSLWDDGKGPYPIQLFHLGRYFKAPVMIHLVSDGTAREILYSPEFFTFGEAQFASHLPEDMGFAGFRVMNRDAKTDWLAFLGAAYFRSSGALDQYGMSTRGIAIDVALPTPEEFPRFTQFWLEPSEDDPDALVIYALMDGPSIAGAFRIEAAKRDSVIMEVRADLFPRADIKRMGVAPLTSMFWYSETNRHQAADWRPEIHDSDGLALWTGSGERIWRPLNDPHTVMTNSFTDRDPRGFGLLQRDRHFYNYEDDGVFYGRRPSVWVEPLEPWGKGAIQLVEIPTDDEIHDNIVAYWLPEEPVKAGSEWSFRYRLHWVAEEPYPPAAGRVIATRLGRGGVPGLPRPKDKKKFVIDFAGGPLEELRKRDPVKPVISASRGTIDNDYALQVVGTKNWRAFFDLKADGKAPVDLRCYLRLGDRTLTETWLYQYIPFEF
jgi:glucans biosynthesis protein